MTLCELATKHGTDKGPEGHGYTEVYEAILADLLERGTRPLTFLEIGVDTGASLRMWREHSREWYLFAVDIEDKREVALSSGADHFAQGDASDPEFLKTAFSYFGFNLVIDDGSHTVAEWQSVVSALLPRIYPGGYLVIEDIHSWPDGWEGTQGAGKFFASLAERTIQASPKHSNHQWDGVIESVTFIKGLCVIRRAR
jgi:hypothetical protein